jgi:hypothetical protein
MTVMTDDRTHFENEDWTVLDSGLEHRRTGYFIARDEIGNRRSDGLWTWPLHMAEKSWCTMPAFVEAFTCAAAVFAVPADADLARSFQMARRDIAASPALARAKAASRAARPDAASDGSETLQGEGTIPISWEPAGSARPAASAGRTMSGFQDRLRHPVQAYPQGATARSRLSRRRAWRAPHWRATHRIRQAGTRIVRLLWAAWAVR